MDVRFCEGRNHRREAQLRAADAGECGCARSSEARVRRTAFPLDKDLHGCRQTGSYPETGLEEINGDFLQADLSVPLCKGVASRYFMLETSLMSSSKISDSRDVATAQR
jgi:hypothetical protein